MTHKVQVFDRAGAILAGPYPERADAERAAEPIRATGRFAMVATFEEWNHWHSFSVRVPAGPSARHDPDAGALALLDRSFEPAGPTIRDMTERIGRRGR